MQLFWIGYCDELAEPGRQMSKHSSLELWQKKPGHSQSHLPLSLCASFQGRDRELS